jgi:hypothetical protein
MNQQEQGKKMSQPIATELSGEDLDKVAGAWWVRVNLATWEISAGPGDLSGNGNVGMRNHQGPR